MNTRSVGAARIVFSVVVMLSALMSAPMSVSIFAAELTPPKAGKPQILPLKDVKPGMQAIAWTTFSGTTPEAVPVEIIGIAENAMGPRQHVIIGKMGGKAQRTGVAGGMSGSPVYYEGKLIGAIALRMSQFSPDAICGITPIESMLEIQDMDASRPLDARTPDKAKRVSVGPGMDNAYPNDFVSGGGAQFVPIDTPLVFSGYSAETLNSYASQFREMGITMVQGGASSSIMSAKPAAGWEHALNPGEPVGAVLVSGDMAGAIMGTVTYNDGKRILAFGHPMLNLGAVNIPMAKNEIVTVLASANQPNKMGNSTEIVGALRQDRHTGIMGELGAEAPFIPVHIKVRAHGEMDTLVKEKDLNFNIFVNEKWTPFLMANTLTNSLQQMNLYADEMTYRMTGEVEMVDTPNIHLSSMFAPGDIPVPMPNVLAGWWGDKFARLFSNPIGMPKLKSVNAVVDLLPARRIATIENAWTPTLDVEAGAEIPVKVFLRPYRGERMERTLTVKIPAGMPKGEHRIQFSDADTLDRSLDGASQNNRTLDVPGMVSVLNQERANNRLYVALVQNRSTYFVDDKTLPNLPSSIANVMQTERVSGRSLQSAPDSTQIQQSIAFDQVVSGSYSLRIHVK